MKRMIAIGFVCVLFCCCKKSISRIQIAAPVPVTPGFLTRAVKYLRANLNDSDFVRLDTGRLLVNFQDNEVYLRMPLVNTDLSSDFILLQTDSLGNGINGRFIHCLRDPYDKISGVRIETLRHEKSTRQTLTNGNVTLECEGYQTIEPSAVNGGCDVVPTCDDCLPEVIVIGYKTPSSGITYGEYINLASLLNGYPSSKAGPGSNGSVAVVYSALGGTTGTAPAKPSGIPAIGVNFDQSTSKPAIDVTSFMKCFAALPDAGASCSITIYVDLPVNDNPSYIFNILTGATGHCFLQLSKTNGSSTVTQFIGFTTSKALAILGVPVAGKMIDNGGHKYNGSFTMALTPVQLATEIQTINTYGSNRSYDMWEYNCVNYAVDVLNAVRPSNPLRVIQLNDVTSGDSYSTPQGLYLTLEQMKNGPEAKNVSTGVVQNAGVSHGACN